MSASPSGLGVCCVCHEPVEPDAPRLGGRAYCARHFAAVRRDRRGHWTASLALILGLAVFVVVAMEVFSVEPFRSLQGTGLAVAGGVLALVPALLWLAFFYYQDRLEPEPKGNLALVFVGALLIASVGQSIIRDLFTVQDWLGESPLVEILGGILVVGFTQEFLKYAVVRYTVYPTPEFDERVDGLIYGTAAGLGYATWLNVDYVLSHGGVALSIAVVTVAVTALAQASFSGIMGYFLGRAKFERGDVLWLPAGLILAAVCNGLFAYGRTRVIGGALTSAGRALNPVYALGLAVVFSIVVVAVLLALVRRANQLTLTREGQL